jgi:hypothetical protein
MRRATARNFFAHAHTHAHSNSNSDPDPDPDTNSYAIFIFCCGPIFVHKRYSVVFQFFPASTLGLVNPVF